MWIKNLSIFILSLHLCQSLPVKKNVIEAQHDSNSTAATESIPAVESSQKCAENDKECEQTRDRRQSLCDKDPGNNLLCGAETSAEDGESEEDNEIEDIYIKGDNGTVHFLGRVESSGANVTTIIKLTNIIENKNFIDMPTLLNNTNVNNIHIFNNRSSDEGGKFGLGYNENGPCCYSIQPKNCQQTTMGSQCRHSRKKICGKECKSRVIHHRSRSKCIPQWPYYNNCNNYGNMQNYYPPQFMPPMMPYPPYFEDVNDEYEDDSDESDDASWKKVAEKCKVVSEDGTEIVNCTESENPYARTNSKNSGKFKRHLKDGQRVSRDYEETRNIPYQPQVIYYPMPVYIQPMPVIIPQTHSQSKRRGVYDDFDDEDDEYSDDEETNEYTNHRQSKHKTAHKKKSKTHQFYEEI